MKIGFLSQSLMNPEIYWNKLQDRADCWWGVVHQHVYPQLRERDHTKIIFHEEERYLDENKEYGNPFVAVNPGESENVVAQEINPDLWISETLNKLSCIPKKVPWIQMFHSMPMKKHFFYPPLLEYDLILLPGEYHKRELIRRLDLKDSVERLKVVGWPRIDDFFNGVFDREQIMNSLGLDVTRKTLLYAPTWGWGSTNKMLFARSFGSDVEVFEKLCRKVKEMELNFIVKLHCLAIPTYNKEMIDIADKYGVLWVTREAKCFLEDPIPLLWATDILISDLSGIITDFLALDRPIIYVDPEKNTIDWDETDMPKSFRVGHVVRTLEELLQSMEDSLRNPKRFSQQRQNLAAKLFHSLDGKAIDRAVNEILNFAEINIASEKG